jgi:hypothetical protein
MLGRVKMLRGVFVLGGIAAAHVPAAQTQPKVHPTVAHLQAFFAAFGSWLHALDLIEMGAVFSHGWLPWNHIVA